MAFRLPDKVVERGLALIALSSIAILALITVFIFQEGTPVIAKEGIGEFFGTKWQPTSGSYGIALMIVGSAFVTIGALILGVPFGIACAIVLAEMAPARVKSILRRSTARRHRRSM